MTKGSSKNQIDHLKELAGLLRHETDRWSRQVILAEAVGKLIELEKQLAKTGRTDKAAS